MGIIQNKLQFADNYKVITILEALETALKENNEFSVSILLKRLENEGLVVKPVDKEGNVIVQ